MIAAPSSPAASTPYRGRFAPSPTGPLHWGSLATALLSWVHARQNHGEWWIRIEDLDPPREIPGMALRHLQDLQRYGLESDAEVVWQSQRHERYRTALQLLQDQGHAFECRCSRSELAAREGIHRGCLPNIDPTRSPAWRLRVPDSVIEIHDLRCGLLRQNLATDVGDFVLWRADGLWAYQLAVVVDDADQGITHIVRGEDLLDSTPRQRYLQRCLGLAEPATLHLPLILGGDGRKLSKSEGSDGPDVERPLHSLREALRRLGIASPRTCAAGSVKDFLNALCEELDLSSLSPTHSIRE